MAARLNGVIACFAIAWLVGVSERGQAQNIEQGQDIEPPRNIEVDTIRHMRQEVAKLVQGLHSKPIRQAAHKAGKVFDRPPSIFLIHGPGTMTTKELEASIRVFRDLKAKGVLVAMLNSYAIKETVKHFIVDGCDGLFGIQDVPVLYQTAQRIVHTPSWADEEGGLHRGGPRDIVPLYAFRGGEWKLADKIARLTSAVLRLKHVPLKAPFTDEDVRTVWAIDQPAPANTLPLQCHVLNTRAEAAVRKWWCGAVGRAAENKSLVSEKGALILYFDKEKKKRSSPTKKPEGDAGSPPGR